MSTENLSQRWVRTIAGDTGLQGSKANRITSIDERGARRLLHVDAGDGSLRVLDRRGPLRIDELDLEVHAYPGKLPLLRGVFTERGEQWVVGLPGQPEHRHLAGDRLHVTCYDCHQCEEPEREAVVSVDLRTGSVELSAELPADVYRIRSVDDVLLVETWDDDVVAYSLTELVPASPPVEADGEP